MLRFGLLVTAVLAWNGAAHLWETGNTVGSLLSQGLMLGTWIVSFGVLVLAVLARPPRWAVWAVPATLLLVFVDYYQVHLVHQAANGVLVTTDLRLFMDYAARLVLDGRNPYAYDLRPGFEIHRATLEYYTPLLDADYTGRLAYPALSPLVFTLFLALGLPSTVIFPVFFVALIFTLFLAAPPRYRPLVLLPLFVEERYLYYAFGGVSDIVWAWLLTMVVATWGRRTQRGLWYGLACSYKHQPWILAPFFLIRVWHETKGDPKARIKEMAVFTGWSVASFAVVNLPFAALDPVAWFKGVTEPIGRDMITLGQGISSLSVTGYVIYPKGLYTLFMLGALGVALYAYHRHFHRIAEWMWVAPGVILWFGNRSLTSYWYYGVIPLALALVRRWGTNLESDAALPPPRSTRPTMGLLGAFTGFIAVATVFYSTAPRLVDVEIKAPILVRGEWAREMTVVATNRSERMIKPRFAVQSWSRQPYFWTVARGPRTLDPGVTGTYQIYTDVPFEMFQTRFGARVAVSDSDQYHVRGSAWLPAETSHTYTAVIPNGGFDFWDASPRKPDRWGLVTRPGGGGAYLVPDGPNEGALRLWLPASRTPGERAVWVNTHIVMPDQPITLRVLPPPNANVGTDPFLIYAVRLKNREHTVLVLFGDDEAHGVREDGEYYWTIPVSRDGWQTVEIDIQEIFAELGITPRALRETGRPFPTIDFPLTTINFQLYLSVRDVKDEIEVLFGDVASTSMKPDHEAAYRRSLEDPDRWVLWQGDYNFEQRNFEKARDIYKEVLERTPTDGAAWYRLGESEFWLGDCEKASDAWVRAVELGYRKGLATRGIGWCHFNAGRMEFAASMFESSVSHLQEELVIDDSALADAQRGRAMAYRSLGACVLFEDSKAVALALNPWTDFEESKYGPCVDRGRGLEDLEEPIR